MRLFYTLIFYFALPLVLLRLYWRGFKVPDYRRRWRERLGFYDSDSKRNLVWLHWVSVGEAGAALPLIKL
ncbi:MAG: glycosyltransferase N-terminal domain-containing protein, partial [Methylomonas sp.]|nr:glycosyltransferase N-terminal domain-containing protein [Methylomonas sp.]